MSATVPDDFAEIVAERVREAMGTGAVPRLLTVDEVASMLQVRREWVYEHADDLGALRLFGRRGRLRFDRQRILDALANGSTARRRPRPQRRRRARISTDVPLLRVGPKR